MGNDGSPEGQYEVSNSDDAWKEFRSRYLPLDPEIAVEVSTTGKYCTRMLRDMGFSVHLADPVKLALIFNTSRKNDKEDSYKLAKFLRMNELPEVHLHSQESDDLRSLVRYRRSLADQVVQIKNRIHAVLASYGIVIHATDIFGRRDLKEIDLYSGKMRKADRIILSDMPCRISELKDRESMIEDEISRMCGNKGDIRLMMTFPSINVYSEAAIVSEIDDIYSFYSKEKLGAHGGPLHRQVESGNTDRRGYTTKHGLSMLKFILEI